MALKFWLGGAAGDQSKKLLEYVLTDAGCNPKCQYLVVVPEQICLKTQKEYVTKSENKGILNIDILPFTRLAHRIGDEVGDERLSITTLDDMGKSLILQHLAAQYKDELSVLGDNIGKLGYIEKVKSLISEFMQYSVTSEQVYELAKTSNELGRGFLGAKLKDTAFLYEKFNEYIKDKYTTVEETLDKTAEIVHKSDTIKNSVIVFDGFTGFTPVQIKLIGKLMEYCVDIHVALIIEDDIKAEKRKCFDEGKAGKADNLNINQDTVVSLNENAAADACIDIKTDTNANVNANTNANTDTNANINTNANANANANAADDSKCRSNYGDKHLLDACIQKNEEKTEKAEIKSHELFYLSRRTINQLERMADERRVKIENPYKAEKNAINNACNAENKIVYKGKTSEIRIEKLNNSPEIFAGQNPYEEIRIVCGHIKRLIRNEGYRYKDIAIITGDIESYRMPLERELASHDIPYFIDKTQAVLVNPFSEFLRSLICVYTENYSRDAVFRFLKSGLVEEADCRMSIAGENYRENCGGNDEKKDGRENCGGNDEMKDGKENACQASFIGSSLITRDEISLLENYCIASGVRGYKKWHTRFVEETNTFDVDFVLEIEKIREKAVKTADIFAEKLLELSAENPQEISKIKTAQPIENKSAEKSSAYRISPTKKYSVSALTRALYFTIEAVGIEDKLKNRAKEFGEAGNSDKQEEYSQIYVKVMNILDELCELISQEVVTLKEYGELLDAALSEIRIGILPKGLDYVQVGDLTRSRLDEPRALFIVGANDGVIPKASSKSGIINDADKEFLLGAKQELMLSPTQREDAYTQRLYLYMMMNAPSEHLYVSYAKVNSSGAAMAPSYIIKQLMSGYHISRPGIISSECYDRIEDISDAALEVSLGLHAVVTGEMKQPQADKIYELIRLLLENRTQSGSIISDRKTNAADVGANIRVSEEVEKILRFKLADFEVEDTIGKALADVLYGKHLVGSVTRLETFAACAYRYFLRYGLGLKEREEFSFAANDMGLIFHGTLLEYIRLMNKEGLDWFSISLADEERLVAAAVEKSIAAEHMAKLYTSPRSAYAVTRIRRIMTRTVDVLKDQLQRGDFRPKYFEVDFEKLGKLDCLNIKLSDDEYMKLKGRIDRVDIAENEDGIYVKIIDYKSSEKSIDLLAVYEGRQLQLLTYLSAAMEAEGRAEYGEYRADDIDNTEMTGKEAQGEDTDYDEEALKIKNKRILPAGILYYHIDDPMVDDKGESDEEIKKSIMKKLRLKGLINSDGHVAELIDANLEGSSDVLGIARKKDGEFRVSKQLVSGNDFKVLSSYVNEKISEIGREILSGNIEIPKAGVKDRITGVDCAYCPYKSVCSSKPGAAVGNESENDMENGKEDSTENNTDSFESTEGQKTSPYKSNDEIIELMKRKYGI